MAVQICLCWHDNLQTAAVVVVISCVVGKCIFCNQLWSVPRISFTEVSYTVYYTIEAASLVFFLKITNSILCSSYLQLCVIV